MEKEELSDSPETLARLYYERGESMSEIGGRVGVTRQAVANWMDKYGMERRGLKESHRSDTPDLLLNPERLRTEIVDKERTREEIAESVGVTQPTVTRWAQIHGITATPNKPESVTVQCDQCGSEIQRQPHRLESGKRNFCDDNCRGDWNSTHKTGENNPNWKGGDAEYGESWTQTRRESVRKGDGFSCQVCGVTQASHIDQWGEKLHVHHIVPARDFDDHEPRNDMDNLISLCRPCHRRWEGIPLRPQ